MIWIPVMILPLIFIGIMILLWSRIRARGQSAKAEFQERFGEEIRIFNPNTPFSGRNFYIGLHC